MQNLAISIFSPVSSQSPNGIRMCVCVCVRTHTCACVDGMNLKCALRWHTHRPFHSMRSQCIHTSTHKHLLNTNWGQWTDGAKSGYCPKLDTQWKLFSLKQIRSSSGVKKSHWTYCCTFTFRAIATFSPISLWSSKWVKWYENAQVCECEDRMYLCALPWHISSFCTMPVHTHTLSLSLILIWWPWTYGYGLKVGILPSVFSQFTLSSHSWRSPFFLALSLFSFLYFLSSRSTATFP